MLPSRSRVLLFLKGMAMGAADSVPGVSGGTIAFITNIYDELLASILAFNRHALRILFTRGPRAAWLAVNGGFLLTLGSGILLALLLSANMVLYLLAEHYALLMSFFVGLILASLWYVGRQVRYWDRGNLVLLGLGIAASVALAVLQPATAGSPGLPYLFLSGALAICAMLLPGISGAFVLLLLGAYEPVLRALTQAELPVILVFAAGCACGLLAFARLLSWLLNHHRARTLALLLGILAGSLANLWPWRAGPGPSGDWLGPLQWAAGNAAGGTILAASLVLAASAFLLVVGLENLGNKSGAKSNSSGPESGKSF